MVEFGFFWGGVEGGWVHEENINEIVRIDEINDMKYSMDLIVQTNVYVSGSIFKLFFDFLLFINVRDKPSARSSKSAPHLPNNLANASSTTPHQSPSTCRSPRCV